MSFSFSPTIQPAVADHAVPTRSQVVEAVCSQLLKADTANFKNFFVPVRNNVPWCAIGCQKKAQVGVLVTEVCALLGGVEVLVRCAEVIDGKVVEISDSKSFYQKLSADKGLDGSDAAVQDQVSALYRSAINLTAQRRVESKMYG